MSSINVYNSIGIAQAIATALGDRFYDVEVVGSDNEAVVRCHYNVSDAEWPWQNGVRTRYICVYCGTIDADVDDYFESTAQEKEFAEAETAYAHLCPHPAVEVALHIEPCEIADEDLPF